MPIDPYLSWEDLLDDEPPEDAAGAAQPAATESVDRGGVVAGFPADFEPPQELQTLFAEKERLEQALKELTGEAEPSPEDERMKRMFPVKAHTKESRIEERRLRLRDELRRMQEKRA
ncbi:MAG: hypothetical protein ACREA0_17820, partial [bacterium]